MLNEPTIEKLRALRLDGMASAFLEQQKDPGFAELSFDERYGLLVDAEALHRENKRMRRYLDEAKLKLRQACIEGIDYPARRELDKAVVRQLATCRWVSERQNVVITGPTGVGKTYVACALAQQACSKGHRTLYRRASRFFDELHLARADGSYARLLKKLMKIEVLIIDDWGSSKVDDEQRRDMMEILDDRYSEASTILTSQLPVGKWHDHLADPNNADVICERILHNAHKLVLKGPSRRKEAATEK
ncbi:MAG: ATP-binding protein [Deltaproteobacteria bacterium]|nr:ATP-binding protein [Deltaproteobacteria bacterium]